MTRQMTSVGPVVRSIFVKVFIALISAMHKCPIPQLLDIHEVTA